MKGIRKIYFIGIGGVSMSALAKLLSTQGYEVSGSDAFCGEQVEKLSVYPIVVGLGVDGNRAALLSADAVVYTDAIAETHEELVTARRLKKKIFSRAELLRIVSDAFPHVLSVAGSHGKTTCASMCAHVFHSANASFTAHVGGDDLQFGNFVSTGGEYFLTEACEYKKNLLHLKPDRAVLLNIDLDHMECYENEAELVDCFRRYCKSAETAFVCADDERCKDLGDFPSFGITSSLADYRARDLRAGEERYSFTVEEYGKPLCRIRLKAIGRCSVYNALAAFAAMRSYGFDEREIKRGLETFEAVKRRFERIGQYRGASFICDYAHHPRELAATIATAEGLRKGRLLVVFQPHTYSRTRLLMDEFIATLRPVKNLMLYKTYPARETYDGEGSAETLAEHLGNCLYAENPYVLGTWLKKTVREGDTVLFLGAGDIYFVAQYLLSQMR